MIVKELHFKKSLHELIEEAARCCINKDYLNALPIYEEAASQGCTFALYQIADIHVSLLPEIGRQGDLGLAAQICRELLNMDLTIQLNEHVHYLLGEIRAKSGDSEGAIAEYEHGGYLGAQAIASIMYKNGRYSEHDSYMARARQLWDAYSPYETANIYYDL